MLEANQVCLEQLCRLARKEGRAIFAVGGTLRDRLMGKDCSDFDFACKEAPALAERFAKDNGFTLVVLDETPGRETCRVVTRHGVYFDFSTLQGNHIEEDLAHRDFTINAIGQPLEDFVDGKKTWIDPFQGLRDIEDRVVRALPGPVFESDPLRILRAFRFANTLAFRIDPDTLERMARTRQRIRSVAAERLSYELLLLLGARQSHLPQLVETGLLGCLIPELAPHFRDIPGAPVPPTGQEALRTLDRMEILLVETEKISPRYRTRLREYVEIPPRRALLKLAVLLRTVDTTGDSPAMPPDKMRSDSIPVAIMKDLRLSNENIRFTGRALAIHQHLIDQVETIAGGDGEDASAIYNICKQAGDDLFSSSILATAVKMEREDDLQSFLMALNRVMDFYITTYLPAQEHPPLLNGRTLARKFKLTPSPRFKIILDQVEEARVLGRIGTREEAEALAAELIQQL